MFTLIFCGKSADMDLNSTLATTYSVRSDFSSFPLPKGWGGWGGGETGEAGKKVLKEMGKKVHAPFSRIRCE